MIFPDFFTKTEANWIIEYYKFDIKKFENDLVSKNEIFWIKTGGQKALRIFHAAAERVPAYRDFLKKNRVNHKKIKSISDFLQIPLTDKKNYIDRYPLAERSWEGKAFWNKITAASSGTTGHPNYWPRSSYQEFEAAVTHELLYKNFFNISKKKTLLIVGFPLGVYVSGMATVLPSWLIAQKYALSVVSCGNNKIEVLKTVKGLYKNYEQVILIGHPFFLKDVIETGKIEGVPWKKMHLNLMLCSEGFSEQWREYLMREAGIKNKFGQTLSTYGSSEMLLMAYETPISILLKTVTENKPELGKNLFGRSHVPNVFQYNPTLRYIESINRELIFTSASGLPLIRFNLHDSGVILPFSKTANFLNQHLPKWKTAAKNWPIWQLPLVSLWGRSDHTIIFYAANIYPEHIHAALHQPEFLKTLTGKFTLRKWLNKSMDEFLEINLELRPSVKYSKKMPSQICKIIFETLKKINSEFFDANRRFGNKTVPKIKLWTYQHPQYFKQGLKPKYIQ